MVMQDPKFSLNPVMRIGKQLVEALRAHERVSKSEAQPPCACDMLEAVQIDDPERVYRAFPHELSGGMGQRAMIAMMLLPGPDLADRRRADIGARRHGAADGAAHSWTGSSKSVAWG